MKKRAAVYGVITLMLCMAAYLNWSYTTDGGDIAVTNDALTAKNYGEAKLVAGEETQIATDNYFSEARLTRQKARDEAISILETGKNSEGLAETAKTEIAQTVTEIATNSVKEARIESLIKAKGFEDVVVFLSDDDVSVIVAKKDAEFSAADAAKIKDIVMTEADAQAKNIKITKAP